MDEITFIQTYIPLRPIILQVCISTLLDEAEAEDITQDVLIRLWEKRTELDCIASPKAYAIRMAHNKCIDTLRSPTVRLRSAEAPSETDLQLLQTPQDQLIAKEQQDRLRDWTASLPRKQQQVWHLRQEQLLTNAETAKEMGLKEVTIRSMISRLRKEARKLFEEQPG